MFCHDGSTIYHPTAPGRVYRIGIIVLADCSGSDEDLADSTFMGDISDLARTTRGHRYLNLCDKAPVAWPPVHAEVHGDIIGDLDPKATDDDFHDALEQWADWCDRDSVRLDSLDAIMGAVEVAA